MTPLCFYTYFQRTGQCEMRPYLPGEDLSRVSVSEADKPPKLGDMIARNPKNHEDQWLVNKAHFITDFTAVNAVLVSPRPEDMVEGVKYSLTVHATEIEDVNATLNGPALLAAAQHMDNYLRSVLKHRDITEGEHQLAQEVRDELNIQFGEFLWG